MTAISDNKLNIAIFGGTFDPVHLGHIGALELLCAQVHFDQVHFVLSARPPHKDSITAAIEHRFTMLQLALHDYPKFEADDTEIRRRSKSYTINTVESFYQKYPNCSLTVIIGGDSLLSLPSWHRYPELIEKVNWVVLNRPSYSLDLVTELQSRLLANASDLENFKGGKIWLFEQSKFEISSTKLRAELNARPRSSVSAQKDSRLCKEFLSDAVFNYIKAQQLYRIRGMKPEQIKDQVIDALESVKAQDIRVIDIADISDFADYMVVASGTSDTHVKALARTASDNLRTRGVKPLNEDGADVGEWVLVDFGDVVLHVMRPEVREYYDLEKLWDKDVRAMVKKHREEQDD